MKRISAIDLLRGVAVMGILLMNMMSFAMPEQAYMNPLALFGESLGNRLTFFAVHILIDQKFMAIFSMLFGASVILLSEKFAQKRKAFAAHHYRRNLWLLLIGLAHTVFLWDGDILTIYALAAFILYFLRKLRPRLAIGLGLLIFLAPVGLHLSSHKYISAQPSSAKQKMQQFWIPSAEALAKYSDHYRGDYSDQVLYRLSDDTESSENLELFHEMLLLEFLARSLGMMLIGMGFFKNGTLSGDRSKEFYRSMVFLGFGIGLPLAFGGLIVNEINQWQATFSMFLGRIPNQLATWPIAAGFIGLVILWSKTKWLSALKMRVELMGKMALTNYLMQSLIGTWIFYGYGLGLYGSVNRWQQLCLVLGIWSIQLLYSKLWLSHFRYGPAEWLWRSLTLWKVQRLLIQNIG